MSQIAFSGTREHALLALVIQQANESKNVPYLGRTALQKIVYFLKALGVPMRYSFDIYHYGPFSDQITSDMDLLMADGIIEDRSPTPTYWNYAPRAGGPIGELLDRYHAFVDANRPIVKQVVESLGPLKPPQLELFATLHYAYRYEIASTPKPSRETVLARFREYKGNKFPADELSSAYASMVEMNLISE